MSIYVYKNSQQFGPFEERVVLEWLKNGQLTGEDYGCPTGTKEWQKLKSLFANPEHVSTPVVSAARQQEYSSQAVVDWARQNLQTPVKVKGLFNSWIFTFFSYGFLSLIFLVPPCLILISTFNQFMTAGLQDSHQVGLVMGLGWLVVGSGLFLFIAFTRRNIPRVLTSEGVKSRWRKNYRWENLYFLNYKTKLAPGGQVLILEMVFANGKAVIPPQTSNRTKIFALLETMPVQRRDNGRIR